jgi:regulator of RNase E activity RraB
MYRSKADQIDIRTDQIVGMPDTIAALRQYGVTPDSHRRVEFFFYTNSIEKAGNLSAELIALGYSSNCGDSPGAKNEYSVIGWTTPLKIDEQTMFEWISQMCNLGAKHDGEFDGWGMDPSEEHVD